MYSNGFWLIVTSIIWNLPVTLFAGTTDYLALISPSMQPDRTWEAILPDAFPGITILPSTKGLKNDEIYKYENRMEPDFANVLSVISQSRAERLVIFVMLDSQIRDSHHMLRLTQVDALGRKSSIMKPTDEVFRDIADARRGQPVDVYITSAGGGEIFGSLPKGSSVVTLSGPRESTPGNETENMFELFSVAKKMFRSDVGIERLLLTHLALVNTSTQSTLHMGSGLAIVGLPAITD